MKNGYVLLLVSSERSGHVFFCLGLWICFFQWCFSLTLLVKSSIIHLDTLELNKLFIVCSFFLSFFYLKYLIAFSTFQNKCCHF